MPLDPSIALSYQPIKIENPMNSLAAALQLRAAQAQFQKSQKDDAEANKLNALYSQFYLNNGNGSGNREELFKNAAQQGLGSKIPQLQKSFAESDLAQSKADKERIDLVDAKLKQSRSMLDNVLTPEQFLAWHEANHADPILGPTLAAMGITKESARKQILQALQAPGGFQQLLQKSALGLEKFTQLNKPQYMTQNTGATTSIIALPGLGGAPNTISSARMQQTPDSIASQNTIRRGQDMQFNTPQYMDTDQGLVAVPKKIPLGQTPVGVPVLSADGQPLSKPLKPIPSAANTAIVTNNQSIQRINDALKLLSGESIGSGDTQLQGDKAATGWKGYLPNGLLNRIDPKGVDARAIISDIGSLKLHERSGAAVTASESPRLIPFIPLSTDDHATAVKKLKGLLNAVKIEQTALKDSYSKDQGYRPSGVDSNNESSNQGSSMNDIHSQAEAILRGR